MKLICKIKKRLKRKGAVALLASCLLMMFSSGANAFACRTAAGAVIPIGGGTANVYIDLAPSVGIGENLVVDLANQISCHNDFPQTYKDYVSIAQGSAYGGALKNFQGTLEYGWTTYPFPLTVTRTDSLLYLTNQETRWLTKLYLKAIGSGADGIAIKSGSLVAVFHMYQMNNFNEANTYIWNIYAKNSVVIPTGGCDVSARNVAVRLPDYPGSAAVPLTVHCAQDQKLAYYLTGTTADAGNTVFSNTSSSNPAKGLGVQLSNRNGIIASNRSVSLGTVGKSPVSLGLTASYGRTTGDLVGGDVQSVIGVTFVYE